MKTLSHTGGKLILFLGLWFCSGSLSAQLEDYGKGILTMDQVVENARRYATYMTDGGRQYVWGAKLGVVLELGKYGHSGYRVYLSGGLAKNFSQGVIDAVFQYQMDMVLYSNGLGSSVLPSQRNRLNFEVRNHVGLAVGGNDGYNQVWGRPLNPNIGDETSVFNDPMDYSFQLGTVFVNGVNHRRNQQIGFMKGGIGPFSIYYMNDGPPFDKWGLGDTWDRYWTGVGGIGFHWIDSRSEITSFEIRYSRYTGDEPYLYDLSSDMRMNYLPHKDKEIQFFNKGRYQYRMGFGNFVYAGLNIYQPKSTDVQRLIHSGVWALHSNPTERYYTVFGSYNFHQTYLFE